MNSSVIVFPGSNCDRDVAVASEKLQFKNKMVWQDTDLPKSDLIVIQRFFLWRLFKIRAIAAKSNILAEVIKAAKNGSLIIGICNGFQILIETGLLDGVLLRNKNLKFLSKDVFVKVLENKNKFCNKYKKNEIIIIEYCSYDEADNLLQQVKHSISRR